MTDYQPGGGVTFEFTLVKEHWKVKQPGTAGLDDQVRVRSTWRAADGWAWASQIGDDRGYFLFAPTKSSYAVTDVPADPVKLGAYLRAKVSGSLSVEEALFAYVGDLFSDPTLPDGSVPATYRSALVAMLALVKGVSVNDAATDPLGRTAIEVAFVDQATRPGQRQFFDLNPTDYQLLASGLTAPDGEGGAAVVTSRTTVNSIPGPVIAVLGTDRTPKTIWN